MYNYIIHPIIGDMPILNNTFCLGPWDSMLQNPAGIALAWASSTPSTTSKCRCCTNAIYTMCMYVCMHVCMYVNEIQIFNFRFAMALGSMLPVSLNMYLCSRNLTVEPRTR